MVAASELPIDTVRQGTTATDMANAIFGNCVTVTGATSFGDIDSAGIHSGGTSTSPGATPGDTGVILSTGNAEDFTNSGGQANQRTNTSTNTTGTNSNNSQYNAAAGARTYDTATLDIDFIPDTAVMTMQFVFSSEEYPEFEISIYQDFVGIWINGTLVPMDVGNGDVDPGNVNTSNNINMYVSNQNDQANSEMDGFTITLTLTMFVNPDVLNSMRIAIADVADNNYDSNLLIAGNSVQTDLVAITDTVNVFPTGQRNIDVLGNDIDNGVGTLTITHINGTAVSVGTVITLPTGQTVQLNANGTLTVTGDGDVESFNFTYTIDNGSDTDVDFVNASSVPCFVAGTLIATPTGEAEVLIAAGDLVYDRSVLCCEGGEVCYVHLMFDRHQVVFSEGLETETFLPGRQTTKSFEAEIVDEMCAIFPELDPATGQGYSRSVRRTLKKYEANLFLATQAA